MRDANGIIIRIDSEKTRQQKKIVIIKINIIKYKKRFTHLSGLGKESLSKMKATPGFCSAVSMLMAMTLSFERHQSVANTAPKAYPEKARMMPATGISQVIIMNAL